MKASTVRRKFETLILALGILMAVIVGLNYSSDGIDRPVYTTQIKPASNQTIESEQRTITEASNKQSCNYLNGIIKIN
jgi:hypothetical protein